MQNMDTLALRWKTAKANEDAARERRIDIENEILRAHPAREEGAETIKTAGGARITLTGKLSHKVNVTALQSLVATWPADLQPIKIKTEADEGKLKAIRRDAPDMWAKIAPAVTVKPAKTGVSIEWEGE